MPRLVYFASCMVIVLCKLVCAAVLQKKAHRRKRRNKKLFNQKERQIMNHSSIAMFATVFCVYAGYASSQDELGFALDSGQGSHNPGLILESALEEIFGTKNTSPLVGPTPPTPQTTPLRQQPTLPSHIAVHLKECDIDWLNKTVADASAIQNFALQQMHSPGSKPDAAFLGLSPMHQQSAMAGVSFMQQFFGQSTPCSKTEADASFEELN